MTADEQKQINRLINQGSPANLSLAYSLLLGLGKSEVEALKYIAEVVILDNGQNRFEIGTVIFRIYNCYTHYEYIIFNWETEQVRGHNCRYLTECFEATRHIWEGKI